MRPAGGEQPLSVAEIERLVRAFAELGVWKVRLTGGEPTVRRDIADVVRAIAAVPGVRRIGLTTNGYRLAGMTAELRDAGLSSVNVSVDSLDPSGSSGSPARGCSRASSPASRRRSRRGSRVKVNVVLLAGMDEAELGRVPLVDAGPPADGPFHRAHADARERRLLPPPPRAGGLDPPGARGARLARLARDANDGPAIVYGHSGP